jgi:hypothetical protein
MPRNRTEVVAEGTTIDERFASAAMDDRRLGEIRGGLDAGRGVVVSFSFREATYVNHNLAQSIVVPTMTISPSTGATSVAGALDSITQAQVRSVMAGPR